MNDTITVEIKNYKGENITYILDPKDKIDLSLIEVGEEPRIEYVEIDMSSSRGIKEIIEHVE